MMIKVSPTQMLSEFLTAVTTAEKKVAIASNVSKHPTVSIGSGKHQQPRQENTHKSSGGWWW